MYKSVNQKLNELIENNGFTINSISQELKLNQKTLSNNLKDGADIKFDIVDKICSYFGVSIDSVVSDAPKKTYNTGRPYYNVDFLGGFGAMENDQTLKPEYNIDFAPYNREGVVWCNITGRSMEPEINSGDIIALKEVQDWFNVLIYGEIYAIVTKNDLRTIKKVKKANDKDHYLLVPSNPEYDAQEIAKESILKVYQVLGCMKRF